MCVTWAVPGRAVEFPPSGRETERVYSRVLLAVVLSLAGAAAAAAGTVPAPLLLRLYLQAGGTLVTYGEYTRTPDLVVFAMPVAGPLEDPPVQILSLPSSLIDWARTEGDAAGARYHHYAATRGEAEYAQLTDEVARTLNLIAATTEPRKALELAGRARTALLRWPAEHYGYRAQEIAETAGILEASIGALRAKLGVGAFDVALSAHSAEAPVAGLPAPVAPLDVLNSMLVGARATPKVEDRLVLLQAASRYLSSTSGLLPVKDAARMRSQITDRIVYERKTDQRYAKWSANLLAAAADAARQGKVAAVKVTAARVVEDDRRMGRLRPEVTASLLAAVQQKADEAAQLRLTADRRQLNRGLYARYEREARPYFETLEKLGPALTAVRAMEGPSTPELTRWANALAGGSRQLEQQRVPDGLSGSHGKLVGAWNLAAQAIRLRQTAVSSGSMATATEASSAAAGALMLIKAAQADARAFLDGSLGQ